jgi:hypothetical protein
MKLSQRYVTCKDRSATRGRGGSDAPLLMQSKTEQVSNLLQRLNGAGKECGPPGVPPRIDVNPPNATLLEFRIISGAGLTGNPRSLEKPGRLTRARDTHLARWGSFAPLTLPVPTVPLRGVKR